MKKAVIAVVAIATAIPSAAFAADVALKAQPAPVSGWTGFYVGGNVGWVGSANNTINNAGTDTEGDGLGGALAVGVIPAAINLGYSGFLGGGQVGYNWQSRNIVYGLEADLDAVNAKNSATLPDIRGIFVGGLQTPLTINVARQLDWVGTLRVRLGFTPSAPLLLYATGGLAYGEHEVGIGINDPTARPPALLFNQTSSWSNGWTLGVGGEWMFAPRWSLKAEYLYVDLGGVSSTINYAYTIRRQPETSTLTASVNDHDNILRGGINYHF